MNIAFALSSFTTQYYTEDKYKKEDIKFGFCC